MNFRELVDELERRGEMLTVSRPVSGDYELPALLQQAEARGKACRFSRVEGAAFPAVGGVLTTMRRWALALGLPEERFDAPEALEAYMADAVAAPIPADSAESGPVTDVSIEGEYFDTSALPAPLFFSGDSHRFISAGVGIAIDPEHGTQNIGFYRSPIIDARRISLSTGATSDLRRIYNWHRENATELKVAFAIGVPPALQIAAAADLPAGVSDIDVAGALQNEPMRLVKCRTSDILVPADAEIVIEATVELDNWVENTMGEYGDLYGVTSSPVARIDRVMHRTDPLFQVIMAGMNREHNQLGRMLGYRLRAEIMERLEATGTKVADVSVDLTPQRLSMRAQAVVAIDKTDDAQPAAMIDAVFGMRIGRFPMSMLLQSVVVVDTDVDLRDPQDVAWAIASRMVRARQFEVFEDRTGRGAVVTRLGLDATAPLDQRHELRRPDIPSVERFVLDDYLDA